MNASVCGFLLLPPMLARTMPLCTAVFVGEKERKKKNPEKETSSFRKRKNTHRYTDILHVIAHYARCTGRRRDTYHITCYMYTIYYYTAIMRAHIRLRVSGPEFHRTEKFRLQLGWSLCFFFRFYLRLYYP